MNRLSSSKAFSLVELLVVCAIIGVLISILLPAIQQVRNSATNAQCQNNLRQLGIALHGFHDSQKKFPANGAVPFYVDLLPYVDQQNQVSTWQSEGAQPVDLFLCPMRRNASVAGARVDYAGAANSGSNKMVLGGTAVKLETVNTRDGSSHTLMVGHKACRINTYGGTGQNDALWSSSAMYNAKRLPTMNIRDSFMGPSTGVTVFGANHPGKSANALMTDGSIQALKYGISSQLLTQFFDYNTRETIRITDEYPTTEVNYNTGSSGSDSDGKKGTDKDRPGDDTGGTTPGDFETNPGGTTPGDFGTFPGTDR